MEIILASTSRYRQQLFQRLQLPFSCQPPEILESALPNELPSVMSERLAIAKAQAVATQHPSAMVIGSDQVASINGSIMGKPGDHATARQQLLASAGNTVTFWTGVAVVCTATGFLSSTSALYSVRFRALTLAEIEGYLEREQPYDCAGSFKCEGLGVALFDKMEGNDPTSLEGLPLIATSQMLREAGIDPLARL